MTSVLPHQHDEMKNVTAFLAKKFVHGQPHFRNWIKTKGLNLVEQWGVMHQSPYIFNRFPNIITWKVKEPESVLSKYRETCNILLTENGLLRQSAGFFVSTGGWFADSHLAVGDHRVPTVSELTQLQSFVKEHFGWGLGQGVNPEGPILIVLQYDNDSSVRFGWDKGKYKTPTERLLALCSEYLPKGVPVLVRPHPLFRSSFLRDARRWGYIKHFHENWKLDDSRSIYELVPKCRAMVSICSTVVTEASTTGIPIFALGTGPYSRTGAVYEGEEGLIRYSKLAGLLVDTGSRLRYTSTVLRDQIPMEAGFGDFDKNEQIMKWVKRCQTSVSLASGLPIRSSMPPGLRNLN